MSPRAQHPAGAPDAERAAGKLLAQTRVRARALAASVLHDTLTALAHSGHGAATQRAVAGRLGVSHTQVQRWCGDGDPAVALGDVLAMGPTIARAVLTRCLGALEDGAGPTTRDSLDGVAIELGVAIGALHTDLADGREDHPAPPTATCQCWR